MNADKYAAFGKEELGQEFYEGHKSKRFEKSCLIAFNRVAITNRKTILYLDSINEDAFHAMKFFRYSKIKV